jgi:flagellar basal body-associated protein FliL
MDGDEMILLMDQALADYDKTKNPSPQRGKQNTSLIMRIAIIIVLILSIAVAVLFWVSRNQEPAHQSLRDSKTYTSHILVQESGRDIPSIRA